MGRILVLQIISKEFCPWDWQFVQHNNMVLLINPMKILVRLVLNWNVLEIISRFCANLSAIGGMCATDHDAAQNMTHSCVPFITRDVICSWLIHTCDMTHSYVCHDSFICVTWLIHVCDMTRSSVPFVTRYVCHSSPTMWSVACVPFRSRRRSCLKYRNESCHTRTSYVTRRNESCHTIRVLKALTRTTHGGDHT